MKVSRHSCNVDNKDNLFNISFEHCGSQSSLSVNNFLSLEYSLYLALSYSPSFIYFQHFSFIPPLLSLPSPTSRKEDVAQTDHVTFLLQNPECKQKHVRGLVVSLCRWRWCSMLRLYKLIILWRSVKEIVLCYWNQNNSSVITKICSLCEQHPNEIDMIQWREWRYCFHLHCKFNTSISHFQRTIAIPDDNGEQLE